VEPSHDNWCHRKSLDNAGFARLQREEQEEMPSFFLQKSRKTAAAEWTAEQSRAAEVDLAEQSSRAEQKEAEAKPTRMPVAR